MGVPPSFMLTADEVLLQRIDIDKWAFHLYLSYNIPKEYPSFFCEQTSISGSLGRNITRDQKS